MSIYVYIDESGMLFNEKRHQNFTAVVFTNLHSLNNFENKFREAKKIISEQSPELMTKDGEEVKGNQLWSNRKYETYQELILKTLTGKKCYVNIFSKGVDLTNFEENYWQNADSCLRMWTWIKKWLIDDLVISYYNKYLIGSWYEKGKGEKVLFEIHVDRETTKNKFEEKIKQVLETKKNKKIEIVVQLGLDSKEYPGIQMADIIANALQRDYTETGKTDGFEKHFKEKTNFKITISRTWLKK